MIRLTPIQPHKILTRNDAVKQLFTPAQLQAHAVAIDAILKQLGAKR